MDIYEKPELANVALAFRGISIEPLWCTAGQMNWTFPDVPGARRPRYMVYALFQSGDRRWEDARGVWGIDDVPAKFEEICSRAKAWLESLPEEGHQ